MAARQIITEILGDSSKFNRALADATGGSMKFGNILQGIGQGIGQKAFGLIEGAVGNVVGAIGGAIDSAEKYEVVSTKLDTALQANVLGWDGNRSAIDAYLKKQNDLGFGVTETTSSLAQLVAATGDVAKAEKFQAAAMDLARLKGISLSEASDGLTKVEAGSYRILKSLGIELKAGATQTEALAAVQKIAAGQAEAYGKTEAGVKDKLKAKNEELAVSLGTKLLPAANAVTEAQIRMIDSIDTGANAIAGFGDALSMKANPSVADLTKKSHELNDFLSIMTGGFLNADSEVHQMDVAMAELGGTTMRATKDMDQSMTGLGKAMDDLRSPVTGASALFGATFRDVLPADFAYARHAADLMAKGIPIDLIAGQDAITSASKALGDALVHPISTAVRSKELKDILSGKGSVGHQLAAGLHSSDPLVRAAAKKLKDDILAELAGFQVSIKVGASATGTAGHAGGGFAPYGVPFVGNEQGAELFTPASGGFNVTPAGPTRSMLGGGGTQTINIHIGNLYGTDGPAIDMFTRAIASRLRFVTG